MSILFLSAQQSDGPSIWYVAPIAFVLAAAIAAFTWWLNRETQTEPPVDNRTARRDMWEQVSQANPYPGGSEIYSGNKSSPFVADVHSQPTVIVDVLSGNQEQPSTPAPEVVNKLTTLAPRAYDMYVGTVLGQPYTVPIGHTLIARRTGGGKSNLLALIVPWLLEQGVEVWYANAKYMPRSRDAKTGKVRLDISPMVDRCTRVAVNATDASKGALDLLTDAAVLVNSRIDESQGEANEHDFPPVVVVFDELKAAVSDWRKLERRGIEDARDMAAEAIETILTKGREPRVFFVTTGQDAQVQSLKLSQGTMTNFMVRIAHPSLDNASMVNVLPKGISRDRLPWVSSPYQWYVTSEGHAGYDIIEVVDVPLSTQEWMTDRLKDVPVRMQIHSAPNESHESLDAASAESPIDAVEEEDDMSFDEKDRTLAQVVAWVAIEKDITPAEVARRLWPAAAMRPKNSGVGSYGVKAKKLMEEAHALLEQATHGSTVTDITDDTAKPGDKLRLPDGQE